MAGSYIYLEFYCFPCCALPEHVDLIFQLLASSLRNSWKQSFSSLRQVTVLIKEYIQMVAAISKLLSYRT